MPWVPKNASEKEEAGTAPAKESAPAKEKKKADKEDKEWNTIASAGKGAKGGEAKGGKKGKSEKKGKEKGKGKGDEAGGKSKRDREKPARSEPAEPQEDAPRAASRGKEGKKGKGKGGAKGKDADVVERSERANRRKDDSRREAKDFAGEFCTIRKHSSMGCAIVSMNDWRVRQAILNIGNELTVSGLTVQLKPQVDKETQAEIMTDLFVGWGRQTEKTSPLSEEDLADFFDSKHEELLKSGRLDQLAYSGGEEQKRAVAKHMNNMQGKWAQAGVGAPKAMPVQPAPPTMPQMPPAAPAGAPPPVAAMPPGAIPGAQPPFPPAGARQPPPAPPGQAQANQQAQAQWAAAMQAQYVRHYQQQQYLAQVHAQQQAWAEHMRAAEQAQREAAEAMVRQSKAKGFKASYRVPTDEEVKAKLLALQGRKESDAPPMITEDQPPAGEAPAPAVLSAPPAAAES